MGLISNIKRFFNSAVKKLWKMIKFIMTQALERFMAEMLDFALDTVKTLMTVDISTMDKRRKAFDAIKKEAEGRMIEHKDSWVNLLLETAVVAVKREF